MGGFGCTRQSLYFDPVVRHLQFHLQRVPELQNHRSPVVAFSIVFGCGVFRLPIGSRCHLADRAADALWRHRGQDRLSTTGVHFPVLPQFQDFVSGIQVNTIVNADSNTPKSVAIVGGGFTGLTAAWRLARQGVNVTVYEAGSVVGGLAGGCEILGQPVERAYHFLYKTDEYMLGMLEELGIRDQLTYHKSSVSTYYDGTLYPMMNPIDLIKFKPLSFINRIRAGVSVLYLQKVKNWQKLTGISAMDWLTKYAGKQVTDVIWEPLLRGKFDRYYDKVTMCWLWGRIKQRVESRDDSLKGEALGYIKGGFATVVHQLVEQISKHGGTIKLNSPVSTLTKNADDTLTISSGDDNNQFDKVLLTVPCKVAHRLLAEHEPTDPDWFGRLTAIDYLDAAVMLFATDEPISDYYWHNINTPNSPFVVFLSLTSLIGTQRFGGKHVYYIGDYIPSEHPYMTDSEDSLRQKWFSALGKMFPNFSEEHVIDAQIYRFKDAQHIVDIGFEDKIPDYQTPCPNVLLCNFAQIFPMDRGTNYAVRDGYAMADRLMEGT